MDLLASGCTAFCKKLSNDEVVVRSARPYEFANALAVLEHRELLSAALADETILGAAKLVTRIDAPPASLATLLALARRHGLSACDAAHLELAQRLRLVLAAKDSPCRARAAFPLCARKTFVNAGSSGSSS